MSYPVNYWSGVKGGVGKSWCARLDCQRYLDHSQPCFLVDADKGNTTASNYYSNYKYNKQAFFSEAPERASTANPVLDAALERPTIVNCRAGTNEALLTWLVTKKVPQTASRLGIRMRYMFVSDLEPDSLNLFKPTLETIGQHMPIIFVANLGRNTTDLHFFELPRFQALLEQYQVPVLKLGLFDLEMKKVIDGRNKEQKLLTWGEARDYPDFGILGQQEIQSYLEDFYEQLDRAEGLADLAFSERTLSLSRDGNKAKTLPPSPTNKNSSNG